MVEYDGDVVVLRPGNGHVSVDGVPITEATRLPQGGIQSHYRETTPFFLMLSVSSTFLSA